MIELNKVMISGRLGADPELRFIPSGTAVTTLNVAVSRTYKSREGEKKEETCWIRVTVWGAQAENCSKYLVKGQGVYVEGRLRSNTYETKEHEKRTSIDITASRVQFLDKPRGASGSQAGQGSAPEGYVSAAPAAAPQASAEEPADEEIPF